MYSKHCNNTYIPIAERHQQQQLSDREVKARQSVPP